MELSKLDLWQWLVQLWLNKIVRRTKKNVNQWKLCPIGSHQLIHLLWVLMGRSTKTKQRTSNNNVSSTGHHASQAAVLQWSGKVYVISSNAFGGIVITQKAARMQNLSWCWMEASRLLQTCLVELVINAGQRTQGSIFMVFFPVP